MIRLALVDDHAILRQGLRSLLEREDDLVVVGEASTEPEAEAMVAAVNPDVVLLDLKLSAGSDFEGLSLCAKLSGTYPDLGLLVLTTFLDEDLVVRAVHAGARGYVVKDVDTTELVRAIRAISSGDSAFDSRSAAAVVRSLSGRTQPREQLTDRELEVLRLLATGLSNIKIGEKLFISATTAKFHVSNIMRKLDVSRRAEAVYAASKRGLI
ncbi:two-component system, regulatory protein [Mycolicibacterium mageritense DSM 44476 = CIP 104973]|uniref:DNA-binding response regulator n=1 Tax=Mycolicibacterium mageritense TaxID=53462 RepID=A0ABN5Y6Y9_MYCME|nr:two-component system response regulator MnoR [Mycolicibacterium mageritense]MCC9186513.1 two-component system response regulator MnoR [Mycolicibacterium mageritense]BBX33850.1 DNA-binding response regulator [Mycolicibacterium mageritense]GJJ19938.1 DNA-binding response regulator [Mycolicibacterium mageritense]CDO22272.1 two-component system, regulatory protein [Mycolicibacterium mageritense DSM 44476 = CIP 104973]